MKGTYHVYPQPNALPDSLGTRAKNALWNYVLAEHYELTGDDFSEETSKRAVLQWVQENGAHKIRSWRGVGYNTCSQIGWWLDIKVPYRGVEHDEEGKRIEKHIRFLRKRGYTVTSPESFEIEMARKKYESLSAGTLIRAGDGRHYLKPRRSREHNLDGQLIDLFTGEVVHFTKVGSLTAVYGSEIQW